MSLVALRVVGVEASIIVVEQLLAPLDVSRCLHQDDWAVLGHFHHGCDVGLVPGGVIHEVASRCVVLRVYHKVRHGVGPLDELESVGTDLLLAVLGNLAQAHHVACIGGDQLTLLDGPASHESVSFGVGDGPDSHREGHAILRVGVEYLLVMRVEPLEVLVVEGLDNEVLVKDIVDAALLLVEMPLDVL